MTMKLPRKLLSCLLVAAICITTVFGCLMTVSAVSAGTYTIVGEEITEDVITEATATVTFEIPAGVSYGAFDVAKVGASDTDLFGSVTAKVTGGTPTSGSYSAADFGDEDKDGFGDAYCNTDISDGDLARISFEIGAADSEGTLKAYTSVTLELTFTFANGTATKGLDYAVAINDFDFTGRYDGQIYTELDGTNGVIKTGCEHIITVSEDDLVNTDSVNGYSVYEKSICSICKTEFGYQVVPTKTPGKVIYWNGDYHNGATSYDVELDGTGSETDPYIIDSADDLALLVRATIDSADKHFKVADGIDAIVLQPESEAAKAIMSLSNSSDVKNYFEGGKLTDIKTWTNNGWSDNQFKGTLDGNGVTIYGLYYNNPAADATAGLFGSTGACTIKNLTVKNSYIQVMTLAGAIIGCQRVSGSTLEQCAVANCYIRQYMSEDTKHTATNKAAIMVTNFTGAVTLKNCMVYGNDARNVGFTNTAEDCVGYPLSMISQNYSSNGVTNHLENIISLGATPYAKYHPSSAGLCEAGAASIFNNVYTDQPVEDIYNYQLKDGSIQVYSKIDAAVCAKLTPTDTSKVKYNEDFVVELNTNADSIVWQLDSKTGYPTFVRDVAKIDTTEDVQYLSQLASTYTPTFITEAEEGVGDTEDNPYIIESLTDLYGLAKIATYAQTKDKYFKLSDDLDVLVFQSQTYVKNMGDGDLEAGLKKLKNMTADEAEEYLSTTSSSRNTWWNGTTTALTDSTNNTTITPETATIFAGTIDFNGVEIYGMYNTGGGLFKYANNATFKNLTIKSSYIVSDTAGVIVSSGVYGPTDGAINIENCTVANNVVVCQRRNGAASCGGVMVGNATSNTSDSVVNVNNCLVYGNTAKHQGYYGTTTGYDITYGLIGGAGSYDTYDDSGNLVYDSNNKVVQTYSSVTNSIILDCVPHGVAYSYAVATNMTFENVYTNIVGTVITNIDFESDGKTKRKYTISPTIDANGRYYPYIYRYTNDSTTSDASITSYVAKGAIVETDPSAIKGLAANSVVTELNTANDATVWGCTANGYPTPLTAYADTINPVSSLDLDLKAVNLDYNNDGSFNLNFHYEPASSGYAPDLYVAQADLSGFILKPSDSPYAGGVLSDGALMYTVKSLSAREIGDILLPTAVYASGNTALWGKTEQISIKDYAVDVINGKAFYTEDASETVKQQDKDVAAAVINYGEAAKAALEQPYDGAAGGKTIYWDGKTYTKPTGTDTDGNILINNAAEFAYIALKATVDETTGNNYKIADGISNIILQPESSVDADKLMGLTDNTQVKDYLTGKTEWKHQSGIFNGNFDGNGVTVYGLYQEDYYCGLFPYVDGGTPDADGYDSTGITIKNINLKNSYMNTAWRMGAIFGYSQPNTAGKLVNGTINIEGCVVANCYMTNSDKNQNNKGMFTGANSSENLHISGCLVYNNYYTVSLRDDDGNVTGTEKLDLLGGALNLQAQRDNGIYNTIKNSIILDISPNTGDKSWNLSTVNTFEKVYTNVDYQVTTDTTDTTFYYQETDIDGVTTANAQGSAAAANMPNLDWSKWAYGFSGEYPTPITSAAAMSTVGVVDTWGDGKSTLSGASVSETWYDTEFELLDPTAANSETNPYIVDSAEGLAWLATTQAGADASNGWYKVADGIKAFNMNTQGVDMSGEMTVAEVKAALEGKKVGKNWWSSYVFNGHFDGNGVEIYGLNFGGANYKSDGTGDGWYNSNSAGLFPRLSSTASLKNITIKNSYGTSVDYAGALFGRVSDTANATAVIENCVVTNCYVESTSANVDRVGVMGGGVPYSSTYLVGLTMRNCLVYDNIAYNANGTPTNRGLFGTLQGGVVPKGTNKTETDEINNQFENSIILDCVPYPINSGGNATYEDNFINIYTNDLSSDPIAITNGWSNWSNYEGKIIEVNASDLLGDKAESIVNALNTANDDKIWYVGNAWGYPGFEKTNSVMPNANQIAYDGLTMNKYDVYTATDADFSMYATSLNLKTNPYIAFTFAFNKDYKENRGDITVTFTNAAGTVIKETTVLDENGYLNDGWTNNEGAGRYHLYRLTDVAVEDLCDYITVSVKYGDEAVEFGKFSVEGFALDIQNAYKQDPCQYYATRVEAAKALLYYTRMINERYGNVE